MAISTALAVLGTAPFAQAAIVKGTISGTWNYQAIGDLNLNDSFTATYEYDEATIISSPYNYFVSPDNHLTDFTAALSKLRVISGNYDHTFDFTSGVGNGTFHFQDYAQTESANRYEYSYRFAQVNATDNIGSESNYFSARRYPYLFGGISGIPRLSEFAEALTSNNSVSVSSASTYSNVNFSPDPTAVTAVPTPALLPSLAAFGLGVWRKRKHTKQVEV